jgi:hypothetical protein
LTILPCLAMATGANATATAAARQLLRGRPRPRCDWENGTPGTFLGGALRCSAKKAIKSRQTTRTSQWALFAADNADGIK